ncbi:hypothetical protein RDWZM_008995 [Blomia tropicalis]|uniref:Membrane metallo-endopeptidase-like 1 n=1 Tax=Blomia tropicalis TaxID=40697 RepID=A0A9Q0RJC2_BLOTA|nr:hypothetical protein RDWZM_008995 [Blomia tropicalis]
MESTEWSNGAIVQYNNGFQRWPRREGTIGSIGIVEQQLYRFILELSYPFRTSPIVYRLSRLHPMCRSSSPDGIFAVEYITNERFPQYNQLTINNKWNNNNKKERKMVSNVKLTNRTLVIVFLIVNESKPTLNEISHKFDESTINHFLSSAVPSSYSQHPGPNMIPGYHHYYSLNHGPLPPTHNMSTTAPPPAFYHHHKPYLSPIQPPLHPLFPSLHPSMMNHNPASSSSSNHITTSGSGVCLRPGCVKAASDILNLIDESISPCDDFYRFACGGWIHRTAIPDETGHVSIFEQSRERLDIQLKDLIETSNDTLPAIVTMKNMYRSCMNLGAIEKLGMEPLKNSLKELGGWPVIEGESWDEETFDWINVTEKIRSNGFKPDMFVNFKVIADVMNNTRNMIFVDEATLGLRRQLITQGPNHTTVKVYHQLMVDTAILLGAKNKTQVEIEMWDVIALEAQIAHATHDPQMGEKKQSWYLYLKAFADVANQTDVLANNQSRLGHDWIRFVNSAIDLDGKEQFTPKELVMVDNIRYMGQIDYLISFVNKHDKRLLSNYMLWRVVLQNLGTGNKVLRDMKDNLNKHLYGITEKMARWKLCLSQLTGSLAMALSSLYIKHHFNGSSRERAIEMVRFIQDEFDEILHKTEWMDSETKRNAYRKSKMMKAIVGYPEELANDTLVQEHYQDLELTSNNFEMNIRRVRIWAHKNEFKKLRRRNNPHNWKYFANAANVNAFYWSQANSIVIPAGILRDIFFDHDRPQYLNFGTIGYVIGHEITHGFDNIGAQFDEIGNARNWWKNETKKHYNEKAQCMIKQYKDYELPHSLRINGDLTLKENIADNGAIKEAYQAYEKYVSKFGEELSLPGLKYTPKQLFWISAAMNWCSKSSPEMFKTRLDTDSHSPSEARVNVAFSNYESFADSFQCKSGTKSNTVHKCTVW